MRLEMVTEIEVSTQIQLKGRLEPVNGTNQLTGPLGAP